MEEEMEIRGERYWMQLILSLGSGQRCLQEEKGLTTTCCMFPTEGGVWSKWDFPILFVKSKTKVVMSGTQNLIQCKTLNSF